jgi:hypothetical protein
MSYASGGFELYCRPRALALTHSRENQHSETGGAVPTVSCQKCIIDSHRTLHHLYVSLTMGRSI